MLAWGDDQSRDGTMGTTVGQRALARARNSNVGSHTTGLLAFAIPDKEIEGPSFVALDYPL